LYIYIFTAQKVLQKFPPLLVLSEQPPRFVPRQRLLLATVNDQKVCSIYVS